MRRPPAADARLMRSTASITDWMAAPLNSSPK